MRSGPYFSAIETRACSSIRFPVALLTLTFWADPISYPNDAIAEVRARGCVFRFRWFSFRFFCHFSLVFRQNETKRVFCR